MQNFDNITAHGKTYLAPEKPPVDLFWVDPKGHENFWCSVQGGTSGSSSSPRTECRETFPDSTESRNWSVEGATHVMTGTVRVEKAPSSGKVIVGQIHAHNAPDPMLMVTWWNGVARVDFRPLPKADARKVVSVLCPLSKAFKYSLTITPERQLRVNLNGTLWSFDLSTDWDKYPFYFKRGAYVIDHEGPADEGGWVVYEDSSVRHTPV